MKLALAAAVAVISAFAARPASAALNFYVSTPVTGGCAASSPIPNYFPVDSFGISGTDPASITGTGVATGKLSLGDFSILKSFNDCSGALVTSFLSGQTISPVTLIGVQTTKGSTAGNTILTITLTNPIISSYSLGGGSGATAEESLSFSYQKMCVASTPVDGTKATNVCYNAANNRTTTN